VAGDPSIKATLGLDATSFSAGLMKAERAGEQFRNKWTKIMTGLGAGAAVLQIVGFIGRAANAARDLEAEAIKSGRAISDNVAAASRLASTLDEAKAGLMGIAAEGLGFLAKIGESIGRGIAVKVFGEEQVAAAEEAERAAAAMAQSLEKAKKATVERATAEKNAAADLEKEAQRRNDETVRNMTSIANVARRMAMARLSTAEQIAQLEREIANITQDAPQNALQASRQQLQVIQRTEEIEKLRERLAGEIADEAERAADAVARQAEAQAAAADEAARNLEAMRGITAQAMQLQKQQSEVGQRRNPLTLEDFAAGLGGRGRQGKAQRSLADFERADQAEARGNTALAERIRRQAQRRSEEIPGVKAGNDAERNQIAEQIGLLKSQLDELKTANTLLAGGNSK
jgi:hypothetical protein